MVLPIAMVGRMTSTQINIQSNCSGENMDDDESIESTNAFVAAGQIDQCERRIARLEVAFDAMCLLARRPYISSELAVFVRGEADKLMTKDVEPSGRSSIR
jgi:hypothetical protein